MHCFFNSLSAITGLLAHGGLGLAAAAAAVGCSKNLPIQLMAPLARAPLPAPMFMQAELDMLLYGYAKGKRETPGDGGGNAVGGGVQSHALSCLRFDASMHGVSRPTSSCSPPDPATLDLPEGVNIYQTSFYGVPHYGAYSTATIPQGKRFGPFQGKVVNTSEIKTHDDNTFMWEIFQDGKLSHFVDGRGSAGHWMSFVNAARYAQEQNLVAVQVLDGIYYEACKDIKEGTELLVWYGDNYVQFLGIPMGLKQVCAEKAPKLGGPENPEGYSCDHCGKVFAYKYYRDKHLKYTRCVDQGDRKYPCTLCSRSFEKRDRLRIHILHVHEKHRPHKCTVCGKSFSQSSSLNKHMRVHSGERPYKCVYCNKAFTASSILRTHIRQHSGEKPFKCKFCGKAFASHAAHDSHVRRTHSAAAASPASKEKPWVCPTCGQCCASHAEIEMHIAQHKSGADIKDDIDVVG